MSRKLLFVLRGTPGLGRVVAGVELARMLEASYGVRCFLVTYGNGHSYLDTLHAGSAVQVDSQDVMSLGIQPVSASAERVLDFVRTMSIDCVIVDGEPLMVLALKIGLPEVPVVSIMNPADHNNNQLVASTVAFFRHCYGASDYRIIHGLEKVASDDPTLLSTSTIIRSNVLTLPSTETPNAVSVVFGGGTMSATHSFHESCRVFFNVVLQAARHSTGLHFRVFLSGAHFPHEQTSVPANVTIVNDIADAKDVFACEVVVARAGRNTVSEILYLKKRAVLFSVRGEHRAGEQDKNAEAAGTLGRQSICSLTGYDSTLLCAEIKRLQCMPVPEYQFIPGNREALAFIAEKLRLDRTVEVL